MDYKALALAGKNKTGWVCLNGPAKFNMWGKVVEFDSSVFKLEKPNKETTFVHFNFARLMTEKEIEECK